MAENVPPEIPGLFRELEIAMKKFRKWYDIQICLFFLLYPSFMVGSKQVKVADCLERVGRALGHEQLIEAAKILYTEGKRKKSILGVFFMGAADSQTWIGIERLVWEINNDFATQNIAATFLEQVNNYNCFRTTP